MGSDPRSEEVSRKWKGAMLPLSVEAQIKELPWEATYVLSGGAGIRKELCGLTAETSMTDS